MSGGVGAVLEVAGEEVDHVLDGEVPCVLDYAVGRHAVEEAEMGGVSGAWSGVWLFTQGG